MNAIAAVAGVLLREGKFLAVQRPEGKVMAGYWEFPGGKIEPCETPERALARELREELGVTGIRPEFWQTTAHAYAHGHVTLHVFLVPAFQGEPASLEQQRLRWVSASEALALNFLPADRPLVEALGERLTPCPPKVF